MTFTPFFVGVNSRRRLFLATRPLSQRSENVFFKERNDE